MKTLNYYNANIEACKTTLAEVKETISWIEIEEMLPFKEERLGQALKLKTDIENTIKALEDEKRVLMLQTMKASLQDCINEAKTDEELTTYVDMLSKFTFLHPEI